MAEYGAPFAWSFLAATLLPLGSEVAFAAVVLHREELVLPTIVATAGNSLGAFTTYWLGSKAAGLVADRGSPSSRGRRAADLLRRYGPPAIFFSWVPLLGDAMVAAAGAVRMAPLPFVAWVVAGKAARYLVLAWSVEKLG